MSDSKSISPESFEANMEVLKMCADDKRHYQMATFTVIIIFLSGNTALFLPLEYIEKVFGPAVIGLLGLASVVISYVSCIDPRRSWFRAMHKGYKIQEGLEEMGVHFIEKPFGAKPTQGAARTTHLVHGVVAIAWIYYLQNNAVLDNWWHMLSWPFHR